MSDYGAVRKKQEEIFVAFVIARMREDNAFRAALSRADNPATEYQSWEYLSKWCDLDKDWKRGPFVIISAAIARARLSREGFLGIGRAIAECYDDGNKSDPAKAKLRRLLASGSVDEACAVLRSLLRLIASKDVPLCYGKLLNELIYFGDGERIKIKWAMDFYGRRENDSVNA